MPLVLDYSLVTLGEQVVVGVADLRGGTGGDSGSGRRNWVGILFR